MLRTDEVLDRDLHVVEEHLVELALAGDLAERTDSTPFAVIGIASIEIPLCCGAFGSVRTSAMPQSAKRAYDDHTFWPFTTYTPSRFSARVERAVRSLPASGSLNS